jgi:S-formylglutathione hydrolase
MTNSQVELSEIAVNFSALRVPYAVILPPGYENGGPYPLCLVLHGGGGSRQNLIDSKPLYDQWWKADLIPPMVLASPSTDPLSFYFDHPDGSYRWEGFIADDFLRHLRANYKIKSDRASTIITGVSMGGYGSLKIAFCRPDLFAAVAALEPALEPALRAVDLGARNRFSFPKTGSAQVLVGDNRDPKLFESNNPANRVIANAAGIRESGLAIYLEVGDEDVLNLHDGTEFLHRVLWDLDIPHEYHLVRWADHVGPSLEPRLCEAMRWLGSVLKTSPISRTPEVTPAERAWLAWVENGFKGEPPAVDVRSESMVRILRAQFKATREEAARLDPNAGRHYGVLPATK